KTAPTGEYLSTGSFMIRGKKHFLPPTQLVYGFGFLFRLADDESVARHVHARQQRQAIMEENLRTAMGAGSEPTQATDESVSLEAVGDDSVAVVSGKAPAEGGAMDFSAARKKYNLEEIETAAVDEFGEEDKTPAARSEGKRQISAKERRDMRKQRTTGDAVPVPTVPVGKVGKKEQKRLDEEAKFEKSQQKQQQQQQQQQKRGQKGKLRKMKEKYAEQDDEDRELRMALLGASGKKDIGAILDSSRSAAVVEAPEPDVEADATAVAPEPLPPSIVDQFKAMDVESPVAEPVAAAAPADEDDDEDDAPDLTMEQLSVLDTLTSAPLPGDNLGFAIPVCAPYSTLSQYRYRVKLIPGAMKKGKSCKMALTVTLATADANKPRSTFSHDPEEADRLEMAAILANREKELMKAVPESELIMQMLGKAKV
ncbi:hypothetical protein GGI16_009104, partial [Coemansia sp. S142-1]